ncbi:MAG: hypothetical protein J6Z31_10840 [Fibrobacter sp.]|nr:hypothetical protein [Fibrobacter sp.]
MNATKRLTKRLKSATACGFAENLNYDDGFSLCPMNDPLNCEKYGRLYNFENSSLRASVISKVCPSGWTVPDSLDWEDLIAYVSKNNGGEPVGVSLKATTGWYSAGDTVLIEGNGAYYTSQDSTRVGASKGTDRFGFTAYPAGSCWNGSDCYINDDTRFYFENLAEGSSYKLAFDKDDLMYDEDGRYGWISIRCVEDRRLEIDSMPPVATLGSQTWMVKDLSYKGSTDFSSQNPLKACPEGWRLPTESEFMNAASNIGSSFDNGDMTYYTKHLGSWYTNISCDEQSKYTGDCMTSSTYTPHSEIRIRCVQDI